MAGDFRDDLGDGPITVLTRLKLEPSRADDFHRLIAVYAQDVRTYEPGCQTYSVVRAVGAPAHILIIARYDTVDAYYAHVEASHTATILSLLQPMIDGSPVLEVYVDPPLAN